MNIQGVPFGTIDWSTITLTEHAGTTGKAYWRTVEMGNIRIRMWNIHRATWQTTGVRVDTCSSSWKANW
jgi:hypothetical protein